MIVIFGRGDVCYIVLFERVCLRFCAASESLLCRSWIDYATPARPVVANTLKARVKCIRLGRGSNKDPCPQWFRPEKRLLSTARMTGVQSRTASRAATRCASRISPSRSPRRAPTSTRSPWRFEGFPAREDAGSTASLDQRACPAVPLPFPETAEAPLRSKSDTRLLRARAGHVITI